jgi:hypothetical protein
MYKLPNYLLPYLAKAYPPCTTTFMVFTWGVESSLETLMMYVGHCEINPLVYNNFMDKKKGTCTNGKLESGLMH